ncbi:MAG TPA: hypothetical protein VLO07_00040 [Thermoanaerobaculia bacterium]|nr:hypothetical protein [Thermoanaerobaculia bacterium]
MTQGHEDRELARLFEKLRCADEASAPRFRQVLERRQGPTRVSNLRSVAAVSVCVLALFLLWLAGSGRRAPEAERAGAGTVTLGDWRSPTDFLLRTPGGDLLDSKPALLERVPDYSEMESVKTEKGARS